MIVLETSRIRLRFLNEADAPFIYRLLNDPDFIRNIADRGIRTLKDARNYLLKGPLASYQMHGFGLNAVELRQTGEVIGICGLLRREVLPQPDLGYAFLPEFRGKGYALESARAMTGHAANVFGFHQIDAIVNPENGPSMNVLVRCGFKQVGNIKLAHDEPELTLFTYRAE